MAAHDVSERVVVAFAGEAVPAAPLTWGQRALWIALRRRGPEQYMINMRRIVPLAEAGPDQVDQVLAAIGQLVGRHSSLRTRIRIVDGEPWQVVAGAGELPVLLVPADGDVVGTARAVADRLAAEPFDHAQEWPQRVALVLVDGRVRRIVFVFSHTTVDMRATGILVRDLRLLLAHGSIDEPAGPQSVDVARREQGADRRRSDRAVEFWVRGFSRLPVETLPRLGAPLSHRFQRYVLLSEAADLSLGLISKRTKVSGTTALLAATGAVISSWSGTDLCGIHAMSDNRARDGYRDAIAKLNQLGLVLVDVADRPSFAALLPRVWHAALDAYRHAHYDPVAMEQGYRAAGLAYATGVSPHCYFNDMRTGAPAEAEGDPREALSRTEFHLAEGFDQFTWRMRVQILDTRGRLGIALTGDTAYLPPPAAERFLRDIERLLVEAAFGEVPWPWLG